MSKNILVLILGSILIVSGLVKAAEQPCTANEKLLATIAEQSNKLDSMAVVAKTEADKAKNEANATKKKYEELLATLEAKGCK